ncbi:unnamed protein product [Tilletia laevis]|uniref:Uncharacterized protein n=3 Tax=Tilletia TaxID=13289 RepID=A0A8X7MJX6_9BASI|nr:hypothetical protein CF328_g8881 [Tilletia controversa]KAE8183088.1 hypothetical protein CF336_g8306 [Tilletia laevis]KAE8236268.1 hypothetical protein A4X03_0g9497 [Tilletia caries]KAE8184605.1 hypothetical protein CF335_g7968 [Tilletia laevis]KAE8238719.1 hypothetical protein A4X06_0g8652 [Tilletia controversa]
MSPGSGLGQQRHVVLTYHLGIDFGTGSRASTATLFASRATRYRPHHLLFLSWIDSIKDPSIGIGTRQCQFKQVRIHSYAKRRRLQLFNLNRDNCAESSAGGLDPSSPMEPCTVTNTAPLRDSRCRDLTCPLSFD